MREIKFRAWDPDGINNEYGDQRMKSNPLHRCDPDGVLEKRGIYKNWILMQFTGLKDKNGKEIYELCELNNKYRVLFKELKYILQDISNNDIIEMEFNSQLYEITREYSPI